MKKLNLNSINGAKLNAEINDLANGVNDLFDNFTRTSLSGLAEVSVLPEFLIKAINYNNEIPTQIRTVWFHDGKADVEYVKFEAVNTLIRSVVNLSDAIEYLERTYHGKTELEKVAIAYCNALSGSNDSTTAHNAVCDVNSKNEGRRISEKKFENVEDAFTNAVIDIIRSADMESAVNG